MWNDEKTSSSMCCSMWINCWRGFIRMIIPEDLSTTYPTVWISLNQTQGFFHLSEMVSQTIPIIMRILLLIKTVWPGQSNPGQYAWGWWDFQWKLLKTPISFSKWQVWPVSSDFWKLPLVIHFRSEKVNLLFIVITLTVLCKSPATKMIVLRLWSVSLRSSCLTDSA